MSGSFPSKPVLYVLIFLFAQCSISVAHSAAQIFFRCSIVCRMLSGKKKAKTVQICTDAS